MNKYAFQAKIRIGRKIGRTFAILLVTSIFVSQLSSTQGFSSTHHHQLPTNSFATEENDRVDLTLSDSQLQTLEFVQEEGQRRGLFGFEGDYTLTDDHTPIDVIVLLEHSPAGIQVIESALDGHFLSYDAAERIVEDNHTMFRQELSELFGKLNEYSIMPAASTYSIHNEFHRALNGVAIRLPGNLVTEVSNFRSVRAIFPDETFYISEPSYVLTSPGDPYGMRIGRSWMNAHELHNRGITGEGVVVAVIDSGIDWKHPAFTGTFPTIEEMQQRNTSITNEHGINIDGTYYFVGRDFLRLWPGGQGDDFRGNPTSLPDGKPGNNPMEFSPYYFPVRESHLVDNAGTIPSWSSHGTHVAGTIVGQAVPLEFDPASGEPVWDMQRAILGVAPGASVIHYRSLFGSTPSSVLLASLEYTYYDSPDVVNMSLSGGLSNPMHLQNIAINNLMLQNPNKVFVVTAGNTGPNFYTTGNPSGATMAITVSNLSGQETLVGANLTSDNNVDTIAFSLMNNPGARWIAREDGIIVNTSPRLVDNDGIYRVFALPNCGSTAAEGTEDLDIGSTGIGPGGNAFAELFMKYGPQALRGAFILVRRPISDNVIGNASVIAFDPTMIGFPPGFNVLGGVIVIDGTASERTQPRNLFDNPIVAPSLIIDNDSGRSLLDNILNSSAGYATFSISGELAPQVVANSSSRGPVWESFEIKPDVGAHGVNVFSAVPRWAIGGEHANNSNWSELSWSAAYGYGTGTSMAAPHVAGGVALMIQYSVENATRWCSQVIKSRIMNTAINLCYQYGDYGVFDGARQMDVWAAVQADTVVSVSYPRVAIVPGLPFEFQPFETVKTGSFSFGGFNRYNNSEVMSESLMATISNNSNQSRLYTISHEFIKTGRNSLSGATLVHPSTIMVPANGSADFLVILNIPASDALGHHEGYVVVSYDSQVLARLPFAGVAIHNPPAVHSIVTYRPVISTSQNAKNNTSRELVISYTANFGFSANMHLARAVPGIDELNWNSSEFEHAMLGTVAGTRFFSAGHIEPGTSMRGVIFNGIYFPIGSSQPVVLDEEGDFYIIMEISRQSPNQNNAWAWEQSLLVPFSVDNTPPRFLALSINGFEVEYEKVNSVMCVELPKAIVCDGTGDVIVAGNVYDAWLTQAIARNLTFDVWLESTANAPEIVNPFGPQLSKSNNLALWVLVGENKPGNRPVRVEIESDGNFAITFTGALGKNRTEVSLWLIDGYAPVPAVNQVPFGTSVWNAPGALRVTSGSSGYFKLPGGAVWADDFANLFSRNERVFGWAGMPSVPLEVYGWHDWSGLNIVEVNISISGTKECQPDAPTAFSGVNPNILRAMLEQGDVVVTSKNNLGIFTHHSPFVIPAGRTLTVETALNISGNAELVVYGTLVVAEGGRINNQGGAGGTIILAPGGTLVNNGHVENVTNSTFINNGTIINNERFEVRAGVTFGNVGVVIGAPLRIHQNAILVD